MPDVNLRRQEILYRGLNRNPSISDPKISLCDVKRREPDKIAATQRFPPYFCTQTTTVSTIPLAIDLRHGPHSDTSTPSFGWALGCGASLSLDHVAGRGIISSQLRQPSPA